MIQEQLEMKIFEQHLKNRAEKAKEVGQQGLDKFREKIVSVCMQCISEG